MTEAAVRTDLDLRAIKKFVSDWYTALDRHVPFEEIEGFLADDPVRFVFPEATITSKAGLREWYETVTSKFFDEAHHVHLVHAQHDGDRLRVHVVVNWSTRVWTPPEPVSQPLEYEADQDWELTIGPDGRPRLAVYIVNALDPQGDTPDLF